MSVPKRYSRIIQEINSFDFSQLDDSDLSDMVNTFREELSTGRSPDGLLPQVFAVIREVIDRRLGIWKVIKTQDLRHETSDFRLTSHTSGLKSQVSSLRSSLQRASIDDSQIHLDADFYRAVRKIRQPGDGLTFWPYDVQLMGALALYEGKIAEMGTGEGKTVVAVFPASFWALCGKKVHIATVNDYLALRDCIWMGPAYKFLGLNVDCVLSHIPDAERREAYKADITYGNDYEFGFDYLRDNIKSSPEERVQSKLEYIIIDEIDSILMDEATTPLIISGEYEDYPETQSYWKYRTIVESLLEEQDEVAERLLCEAKGEEASRIKSIKLLQVAMADPWNPELLDYISNDENAVKGMLALQSRFAVARSEYKLEEDLLYVVDEKSHTVKLTDRGMAMVEQELGQGFMTLGEKPNRGEELRNFLQLLRAYILHRRDEDYIVHNSGIIIVDEFTGRLAFGKKYEEGLHQAIECKEGLQITPENRVVGKITHPNYFRLYEKMAGMTATAHTEAEEFKKLYKLEVVRIPANKPVIRTDLPDRFYRTEEEKLEAIIEDIVECHSFGRPVLVGTRSVEKSERLSALLTQRGIPHNTLNAKNHAREAEIIKSAGQPYAVTIATNMAGRGTDIALGDLGLGLHVIGSERHGARRIDHQLIGRSGRQGDPGSSRFYLSLQDDLFRIFGREETSALVKALDRSRHPDLERLTRRAQRKSEEMSYYVRKHLTERDDVIDKQRKAVYRMRQEILDCDRTEARVRSLMADHAADLIERFADADRPGDEWDLEGLREHCMADFRVRVPSLDTEASIEGVKRTLIESFEGAYNRRKRVLGVDFSGKLARAAIINSLESGWADYLSFQSEFERSILLRSYVRSNTIVDYRVESARLFDDLMASVRSEALKDIFTYPLPGEKVDSIHESKLVSKQVRELLSFTGL
jgi:preprotein translocase subunit SecA